MSQGTDRLPSGDVLDSGGSWPLIFKDHRPRVFDHRAKCYVT